MKKVFIVDDHTAIREGFKAILERSQRYISDGEASSAEEALELLQSGAADPELFIVDVSLPGASGLDFTSKLRKMRPSPVVVISMHRRYDYIAGAFRAGASAYVAKDAGVDCVIAALDAALAGSYYLDPNSLKLFIDESVLGPFLPSSGRSGVSGLSDRELDVLRLLSAGKRAEEIATSLELSQKTVENHLSNITGKLGARDRFELYRMAARLEGI
jgi:DNA-binding NarL/FixJ family response regulator